MKGIWRRIRQFSIWKVPNYVLEPRGSFLGESVDAIDRLAKFRSVAGTVIVIGAGIYYTGLSHLTAISAGKDGVKTVNLGGGTAGDWFVGIIVSVVTAMLSLPLVSLYLVWRARPGARKATLLQLRLPFIAIVGFWGILIGCVPLAALGAYATSGSRHMNLGIRAAAYLFAFFAGIVAVVWLVKAFYLAATGMFRAEDGHPLLPVIAAPLVAAVAAGMLLVYGYSNPPGLIGLALTWGGTVTIFLLSLYSAYILGKKFKGEYPFRDGPLKRSTTFVRN
jgi:hypothetical protein